MQINDGSAAAMSSFSGHSRALSSNLDRLHAGLSYLQLPQHIATKATQLLPLVVRANAAVEPRRRTTAATVAAVIYMAAREEKYALSLGSAGASLSVYGVYVGREFRWVNLCAEQKTHVQVCAQSIPSTSSSRYID